MTGSGDWGLHSRLPFRFMQNLTYYMFSAQEQDGGLQADYLETCLAIC